MSTPRSFYRNAPGGMNSNLKPDMQPVALVDIAILSRRTQRRRAIRQLKKINAKQVALDGR